mgnify:CR=1 FL=1
MASLASGAAGAGGMEAVAGRQVCSAYVVMLGGLLVTAGVADMPWQ